MMYLLDTNIVGYLLREPSPDLGQRFLASSPSSLSISVISAGELRYGLSRMSASKRARELTARFNVLIASFAVLALPVNAATHYGAIRAHLEASGQRMSNNDSWIAAHALAQDLTVVTNNTREFPRVPGLKVENWL